MSGAEAIHGSPVSDVNLRGRDGFTLVEMVVSLAVLSIVFLSMGSVMMMATKAVPDPDAPAGRRLDAADVLEQMSSELQVATSVTAYEDKSISFTVPDRNGDDTGETISYAWNSLGSPLVRVYNGGTPVMLLDDVQSFELLYGTYDVTEPGSSVTSAEGELTSHTSAVGTQDQPVTSSKRIGQSFGPPSLPADTTSWSVTRILFRAMSVGNSTGVSKVQLRTANADGTPTSTVLEEFQMLESSLSGSYTWHSFTFTKATGLSPDAQLCLLIEWVSNAKACMINFDNGSGSGLLMSTDGGATWIMDASESMVFAAYGTYTTAGAGTTTTRLKGVSMTLTPSSDPASQARSTVVVLNRPTLP